MENNYKSAWNEFQAELRLLNAMQKANGMSNQEIADFVKNLGIEAEGRGGESEDDDFDVEGQKGANAGGARAGHGCCGFP